MDSKKRKSEEDLKISDRVRQALRSARLTQRELSTATGVPQRTICDFLGGKNISTRNLDLLATATGVSAQLPAGGARKRLLKKLEFKQR